MQIKLKDNLFYIGILIFSLTVFFEQLCLGESGFTCFLKGMACGLEAVGIVVIFLKRKRIKNNRSKGH